MYGFALFLHAQFVCVAYAVDYLQIKLEVDANHLQYLVRSGC